MTLNVDLFCQDLVLTLQQTETKGRGRKSYGESGESKDLYGGGLCGQIEGQLVVE